MENTQPTPNIYNNKIYLMKIRSITTLHWIYRWRLINSNLPRTNKTNNLIYSLFPIESISKV